MIRELPPREVMIEYLREAITVNWKEIPKVVDAQPEPVQQKPEQVKP